MDLSEFQASLTAEHPPRGLGTALRALWHDARGDGKRAHEIAASETTRAANHVHAYLHRKEGDLAGADYWYVRVGTERPRGSLETEWMALSRALLAGKKLPCRARRRR
jgi:hypothetical protein